MSVPDTTTFSLQDVINEINPTTDDLSDCVANAINGNYDPSYYTSPATSLLEFRNYGSVPVAWGDSVIWNGSVAHSYDFSSDVGSFNRSGIYPKKDGSSIYIANNNDGKLYQWDISTNHDLTTISYQGSSVDVRTNWAQGSIMGGLWFNSVGTKVFVYDHGTSIMYEHTLSTAWDITSLSATITSSVTFTGVSSYTRISQFGFTEDGKKLIMPHGANSGELLIRKYSMTTGFDLSTINDLSGDNELTLAARTSPEFNIEVACFCYPENNTGDEWIVNTRRNRDESNEYGYDQFNGYSSTSVVSYYEGVVAGSLETMAITNNSYMYTVDSGNTIRQYNVS